MSRWSRYEPPSKLEWEDHMCECIQSGGGILSGYQGLPYQRGGGIGSFFRGLFKMAVPLFKKAAKSVGKQALKTGAAVVADVARGQDILPSLKEHGLEGAAALADKAKIFMDNSIAADSAKNNASQTGGRKKKKCIKDEENPKPKQKRKRKSDFPIFKSSNG